MCQERLARSVIEIRWCSPRPVGGRRAAARDRVAGRDSLSGHYYVRSGRVFHDTDAAVTAWCAHIDKDFRVSGGKLMSFVTTQPEMLSAAASSLSGIGDSMTSGMTAAATPTTGVLPPAADMVSAMTAAQFAAHAEMFQAVSAQAAAIHQQLVTTLGANASSYAATEAANAAATG